MRRFRKKIDIGKVISERVNKLSPYAAFRKEPKKEPQTWVLCPDFKIAFPKKLTGEEQYEYTISAFARSHAAAGEMLDSLIRRGRNVIEVKDLRFWLHAVRHSISHVKGRPLFRTDLKYIFRVEETKEEILTEV